MANKSLSINIFNDEYKAIVCWGDPRFTIRVGKEWGHTKHDTVLISTSRGTTYWEELCNPIIVLKRYPQTTEEVGTLAHEAVHAVYDLIGKIGEKLSAEEIVAHSVGAIVRETLRRGKEVRKRGRHIQKRVQRTKQRAKSSNAKCKN